MPSPAFVRLGPSSAEKSRELSQAPSGYLAEPIELICAQVPKDFDAGSQVWLWLGSDNNKGVETDWDQGIRAIARCASKAPTVGTKMFDVVLADVFLLPRTVEKAELLQHSPETYARFLSEASVVGLNNYASQVVQLLTPEEFSTIAALVADLIPEVADAVMQIVPDAADINIVPRPASEDSEGIVEIPPKPLHAEIADDDQVLKEVKTLLAEGAGGVLLQGPPGTGKTYYAKQIAIKLTGGNPTRIREIQFHPSYQYEDFVEGYVPDGDKGFRLADKHLMQMISIARASPEIAVLVIDEFSRTDPSRVLGETLTYMDGSLRDVEFSLPSGRRTMIPKNLVFIATMNPEDRSVDEIDAAMERRWNKIELKPDPEALRSLLKKAGIAPELVSPIFKFFVDIQKYASVGHAFFRSVKNADALERVWNTQLRFLVQKRFRFDPESLTEVTALWETCIKKCRELEGAKTAPEQEINQPT